MPSITAAITTYKRDWHTLERAINSILQQTEPPEEFLVVDDNDPDSQYSSDVRKHLIAFPDIRYITQGRNCGVSSARNAAMMAASCDYIAYLDDDDEWLPEKLSLQRAAAELHPDAAVIFGYSIEFNDDTGGKKGFSWSQSVFTEKPDFRYILAKDCIGSTSGPLIRLDSLKDVNGFKEQEMRAVEDYELWIRLVKKCSAIGIDKPLYIRHMNGAEHVSRNRKRTFQGYKYIYEEFLEDYNRYPEAKKAILRNIVREGVKGFVPGVLPYSIQWILCREGGKNSV